MGCAGYRWNDYYLLPVVEVVAVVSTSSSCSRIPMTIVPLMVNDEVDIGNGMRVRAFVGQLVHARLCAPRAARPARPKGPRPLRTTRRGHAPWFRRPCRWRPQAVGTPEHARAVHAAAALILRHRDFGYMGIAVRVGKGRRRGSPRARGRMDRSSGE